MKDLKNLKAYWLEQFNKICANRNISKQDIIDKTEVDKDNLYNYLKAKKPFRKKSCWHGAGRSTLNLTWFLTCR